MIGVELITEAVRNLARHKLRSFLTALGIIFGIASVVLMSPWSSVSSLWIGECPTSVTTPSNFFPG